MPAKLLVFEQQFVPITDGVNDLNEQQKTGGQYETVKYLNREPRNKSKYEAIADVFKLDRQDVKGHVVLVNKV